MTTQLELKFELEFGDLLRANTWATFRRWPLTALFILVLLVTLYMVPAMASRGFELADIRGFIIPFLVLVVIPGQVYFHTRSVFGKLTPAQRQHRYSFTDHGIEIDTGLSKATVAWEAIQLIAEKRNAFYISMQKSLFNVLPKRALRTPPDLQALRLLLANKLGSKARLRGE